MQSLTETRIEYSETQQACGNNGRPQSLVEKNAPPARLTSRQILGVTIGVGPLYADLSALAASCFTTHTGVETFILGSKEFTASRLNHPAALRLQLFDYVAADTVVYFDADWLCVHDWSPHAFAENLEIVACRDFILKDEWPRQHYDFQSESFLGDPVAGCMDIKPAFLRQDYIEEVQQFAHLGLPCTQWINSGFLILHRNQHRTLLETALDMYLREIGHHSVYYEQPALNKAIEQLGTPVRLVSRKWNVLAAYEAKWPRSVIGLHIKVKRHAAFLAKLNSGAVQTAADVQEYFHFR